MKIHKWFLALYLVTQDKPSISATQLAFSIGVNYIPPWRMLKKISAAMGQRDGKHLLSGVVEFDDAYIGDPTVGKKRGRGTEKAKVFVALSTRNRCPVYLKPFVTENIRKESVKSFAENSIAAGATILSDACASYVPALKEYDHQPEKFDLKSGKLKWLHTIISNAKAFVTIQHLAPSNSR